VECGMFAVVGGCSEFDEVEVSLKRVGGEVQRLLMVLTAVSDVQFKAI